MHNSVESIFCLPATVQAKRNWRKLSRICCWAIPAMRGVQNSDTATPAPPTHLPAARFPPLTLSRQLHSAEKGYMEHTCLIVRWKPLIGEGPVPFSFLAPLMLCAPTPCASRLVVVVVLLRAYDIAAVLYLPAGNETDTLPAGASAPRHILVTSIVHQAISIIYMCFGTRLAGSRWPCNIWCSVTPNVSEGSGWVHACRPKCTF